MLPPSSTPLDLLIFFLGHLVFIFQMTYYIAGQFHLHWCLFFYFPFILEAWYVTALIDITAKLTTQYFHLIVGNFLFLIL